MKCGSRIKIFVVGTLLSFALYSNFRLIHKEASHLYRAKHTVERNRVRSFDELKKMLPPSGVVGYVSDQKSTHVEAIRDFYLAQYALCPLVLVRDVVAPYVIADCSHLMDGNCFAGSGFVLLQEFDSGIRLYQQKKQ